MRKIALGLLAMAFLTLTVPSTARSDSVHDGGLWTAFFSQGNYDADSSQVKWWFDGHLRFLDDTDGFHQAIVRPGLGWSLREDLVVWGGYGWIHTSPVTGDDFDEHRTWQQITWSRSDELRTIALRPRMEQRFLETGDDVGLRFRQLIRMQHHVPNMSQVSVVAWDEIFFNLCGTDWGAAPGFDQNRLFVGFAYKEQPDSRLRTEIGYLNQKIENPSGTDRMNHLLSINFFY